MRVVEDAGGPSVAIATGAVYADVISGGLRTAARQVSARAVYAVGPWALPASTLSLPYVVRGPLTSPQDLDLDETPGWVHTPGAWHGDMKRRVDGALLQGEPPEALAGALAAALEP